jgi:hypothetical protein
MSKVSYVVESLKTANYIVAAAAVAGTVLMPIPPVRAAEPIPAAVATATQIPLPAPRPTDTKTAAKMPLDLASVARMAPPHLLAQAQALAKQETIGLLTQQQIADFGRTHPDFTAKLYHAYQSGTMPQWTPEEASFLAHVTGTNIEAIAAGCVFIPSDTGGAGCGGSPISPPSTQSNPKGPSILWWILVVLLIIGGMELVWDFLLRSDYDIPAR